MFFGMVGGAIYRGMCMSAPAQTEREAGPKQASKRRVAPLELASGWLRAGLAHCSAAAFRPLLLWYGGPPGSGGMAVVDTSHPNDRHPERMRRITLLFRGRPLTGSRNPSCDRTRSRR